MFNDDRYGGGGFFSRAGGADGQEDGQATTPSKRGGKADSGKRAQNLLPVTTRQVRHCQESCITIAGTEFNLLTLVGRVTAIETTSLKITYTIQDDRGSIEATQWLEADSDMDDVSVVENVLCRVFGSVRTQDTKKILMVFNIKPIVSLNELTSHRLEVALFPKKIEMSNNASMEVEGTSNGVTTNGAGGGGLGNSLMDLGYGKTPMSNAQKQVFLVIKKFQDPGVHIDDINNYLTQKLSSAQINKICEDLMNEGHIYSSVDEHHFLCTET